MSPQKKFGHKRSIFSSERIGLDSTKIAYYENVDSVMIYDRSNLTSSLVHAQNYQTNKNKGMVSGNKEIQDKSHQFECI